MDEKQYSLYIISTPIGNIADISIRAIEALKSVDFILCEDTRQSVKLLNHYEISKPLVSYHKFNETESCDGIIEKLLSGKRAALISDAGTPLISDPGYVLTQRLIEQNIRFCVIPGANALLPSVIMSGFSTRSFTFVGFLSKKTSERKKELRKYLFNDIPVVLYIAAHELKKVLDEINDINPKVELCLNKELTKLYESSFYGNAHLLASMLPEQIKGEYTLVVNAFEEEKKEYNESEIKKLFNEILRQNSNKKEALKELALKTGIPKSELYDMFMKKDI